MSTPYADATQFTYENVTAICPPCGYQNNYNRVTDLGTTRLISLKRVTCQKCGKIFAINGDIISPAYVLLLLESYGHRRRKEYRQCITTLATAYELLLRRAVKHTIMHALFTEYHRDDLEDWEAYNDLARSLHDRLEAWPMQPLVNTLSWLLSQPPPPDMESARTLAQQLPQHTNTAGFQDHELLNPLLREPLELLQNSTVRRVRNRVVHRGYRPTDQEAQAALAEARTVIYSVYETLHLQGSEPDRI